ncbi:hypothetical protein [Algibacter sp. Ld11]|uniref:hypothetical protein n=1 Tax=Algibacter sp. Ld11 TaxID=649150 RepID=UPI00386D3169
MKNWNSILGVFLLVSVYCFGVYTPSQTLPYSSLHNLEQSNSSTHKENLEANSKLLQPHTQQFENLVSDLAEVSFPELQLSYNSFYAVIFSNHILFNAKFKQYQNYLKNILIRQRKSDLIFPFHNFW